MYQERTYREWVKAEGLITTRVSFAESDLFILAPLDVTNPATEYLQEVRWDLEKYLQRDEKFLTTLSPHQPLHNAPLVVTRMSQSSSLFGVGPMAAVAGAVADWVGEQLAEKFGQVVVENGGDIFACTNKPLTFGLHAGDSSPFTGKLKFSASQADGSLGVCTSSATVGHSYSRGKADAVCVIAKTATMADAAATAFCNCVQHPDDIQKVLDAAADNSNIKGVLVAMEDQLGAWGCVKLE